MTREQAIELIEAKAKEILKANGYDDDGLAGRIGDGCEIEGEPLWVYWPKEIGDALGVYADEIMAEGRPARTAEIAMLIPGYNEMQAHISEIESEIRE